MSWNKIICASLIVLFQSGLMARQGVIFEGLSAPSTYQTRISANGSVIAGGWMDLWVWDNGVVTSLGNGFLAGISDDGTVVAGEIKQPAPEGYPDDTYSEAAFWKDGQVTPIGHLPGAEYLSSESWEISGNGSVILGRSAVAAGDEIFRYENGTMTGLGMDGYPQAISYDGSKFIFEESGIHWLWDNGSLTQISTLGDYTNMTANEFDMSSDGSVFVSSGYNGTQSVPIRWENGQPTALPFPQEATSNANGWAYYVSGDGEVVLGLCGYMAGEVHVSDVFIWNASNEWNPVRLNSLFENSGLSYPEDLNVIWAGSINEDGTIIAGKYSEGACRLQIVNLFGTHLVVEGVADTGTWLGRLQVTLDPWVWCEDVSCWLSIPEKTANDGHGWIYVPDQNILQMVTVPGTDFGYSFSLDKWLYLTASGWMYLIQS